MFGVPRSGEHEATIEPGLARSGPGQVSRFDSGSIGYARTGLVRCGEKHRRKGDDDGCSCWQNHRETPGLMQHTGIGAVRLGPFGAMLGPISVHTVVRRIKRVRLPHAKPNQQQLATPTK